MPLTGTKAPTSNTRKGEIISWLKANKIPFNENSKKPELYEIVKSKEKQHQFIK